MADINIDDLDDDDDDLLIEAIEEVELSIIQPKNYELIEGFDEEAGKMWVYPINYPLRSYQFNIVQKALFWNTLVTLPTGLGKTFIAAVVIHNFYRWYPDGKILFLAPTKPLVAQQIRACHDIVGISQEDLGELTGNLSPARRDTIWISKRVFFLTPQIVQNDLARGSCPAKQIVLVVIDEAHKATGNHAYCQVIRELQNYSTKFRVLALSATPGDTLQTVQAVLSNLLIAHVEIRSEESLDIQPYTHHRKIEKVIVPLDEGLKLVKDMFIKVLIPYISRLTVEPRAIFTSDPETLNKFTLLQQRESWRQRTQGRIAFEVAGAIEGAFAVLMSLYHAFELLTIHGASPFLMFCNNLVEGHGKASNSVKNALRRDSEFLTLLDNVQRWRNNGRVYHKGQLGAVFVDHPKLVKLEELLLKHFNSAGTNHSTGNGSHDSSPPITSSTRAMVFSSYRDSVTDISKVLNKHSPIIKSLPFVGQSGSTGLKQKDQLEVVTKFKRGDINVLVATCVGEEGLDIGNVDLIVCFDASSSPTRLVQRMGRAARQRDGSIVILLTEGKEETVYKRSLSSKKSVSNIVMTKLNKLVLYDDNPRMIPRHITPTPDQQKLSPATFLSPATKPTKKLIQKKLKCPYLSSTQYNNYKHQYKNSKDDSFSSTAARKPFSLADCLSEWVYWQGTEHPTFYIEHSMSTLTLVHVMEVQDVFLSDEKAIDNYEEEMRKYLRMEDVIDNNKENCNENKQPKRRDKKIENEDERKRGKDMEQKKSSVPRKLKRVVSSDSDDDEFEGIVKKSGPKQTKLIFSKVEKLSLFSCLPKDIPPKKRSKTVVTEIIDLSGSEDCDIKTHPLEPIDFILSQGKSRSRESENMPCKPAILDDKVSKFKCHEVKKSDSITIIEGFETVGADTKVSHSDQEEKVPCGDEREAIIENGSFMLGAAEDERNPYKDEKEQSVVDDPELGTILKMEEFDSKENGQIHVDCLQKKHKQNKDGPRKQDNFEKIKESNNISLSLFSALDQTFELSVVKKSPTVAKIARPNHCTVYSPHDRSPPITVPEVPTDSFINSQFDNFNIMSSQKSDSVKSFSGDDVDLITTATTDNEPLHKVNEDATEDEILGEGESKIDVGEDKMDITIEQSDLFESLARMERESNEKEDEEFNSLDFGDETLQNIESIEMVEFGVDTTVEKKEKTEMFGESFQDEHLGESSIFAKSFQDTSHFAPPEASTPAVNKTKQTEQILNQPIITQKTGHMTSFHQSPHISLLKQKKVSVSDTLVKDAPLFATPLPKKKLSNFSLHRKTDESPQQYAPVQSPSAEITSPAIRPLSSGYMTSLNQSKTSITDEDSPLVVGKRKRKCNILSTQAPIQDPNTSNDNKKSRRKSPQKQGIRQKKVRGKCLFIDDEAELSGEDDEEEDEEELDSSMEDFLDSQTYDSSSSMYLQALNKSPLVPKTFKPSYQGNVYSQQPEEEAEDWRDFSFVCDDDDYGEGMSEQYDCLDETAVFTQAMNMTEDSPIRIIRKKSKKKRVRNMSFESPRPPINDLTAENNTATPVRDKPYTAKITPSPKKSPRKPTSSEVSEKGNLTADFTLGVDDLLQDLEDFSDDDFVDCNTVSKHKKSAATNSFTPSRNLVCHTSLKLKSKSKPEQPITCSKTSLHQSQRLIDHPKLQPGPDLSISDLFNNTFDDIDPALLKGVDEPIKVQNLDHMSILHQSKHPAFLNTIDQGANSSLSSSAPKASEFDLGVCDLIDNVEEKPITAQNMSHMTTLHQSQANVSFDIPCLKDRIKAKQLSKTETRPIESTRNLESVASKPETSMFSLGLEDLIGDSTENPLTEQSQTAEGPQLTNLLMKPPTNEAEPIVILVNTKALSNNQICTMLRSKYNVVVDVVQGGTADYIISWNTAVIRIPLIDVNNNFTLCKQCERARDLKSSFQNVIVIAEHPLDQGKKKKMIGSKQADFNLNKFFSAVKLFSTHHSSLHLSKSQSQTASLLHTLALNQPRIPHILTDKQRCCEAMLNCVISVNKGAARVISSKFNTVKDLINSKPEELSAIPAISQQTLIHIRKFFKMNVKKRLTR